LYLRGTIFNKYSCQCKTRVLLLTRRIMYAIFIALHLRYIPDCDRTGKGNTIISLWTSSIVLFYLFEITTFRSLDSVSVLRWIVLSWVQSIELLPISGSERRFHLNTETEFGLRNVVFCIETARWDSVQNHNNCMKIPSSQTFRPYLVFDCFHGILCWSYRNSVQCSRPWNGIKILSVIQNS
jgi:hypothetical protein